MNISREKIKLTNFNKINEKCLPIIVRINKTCIIFNQICDIN